MLKPRLKEICLALYEATDGKNRNEIDAIVERFVKVLSGYRLLASAPALTRSFSEIYDRMNNTISAKVYSARELSRAETELINESLRRKFGVEKVNTEEVVDPNLIGGIRIEAGETVIDGSVRSQLKNLRAQLIKV